MAHWDSNITYDSGYFFDTQEVTPIEPEFTQPLRAMRQLTSFFKNPFDSKEISLAELCAFTTDTLENLQADNPAGVHDARIAGTTAAYSVVETCFNEDIAKLGTRKARKTAKNLYRENLREGTERVEIALKAAFGPKAAEVQQAFPSGRNIFNTCTDDHVNNHLSVMNSVVAANAASLLPATVTFSASLLSGWTAVYAQSESATAAKGHTEVEKRAARQALQHQLYLALAHLMLTYPAQPAKLQQYMKQHLLEDHPAAPGEDDDDEGGEPEPPAEG